MRDTSQFFPEVIQVAAAPNQVIHLNLVDAAPLWVVPLSVMRGGSVEVVVLDDGGRELHRLPAGAASIGGAHVDLSVVDSDRAVRIEVRRDDVCILPPLQVTIGALRRHAANGELPVDQSFSSPTLIRAPRS